jgi:hypothetical protein
MGYKQLIAPNGAIVKAKKVNKLNSTQSYTRTLVTCTKYFNPLSKSAIYSVQIQHYFIIFRHWAMASHGLMKDYYSNQYPTLYESTFSRYCSGVYVRCDINKLANYFDYFKGSYISGKLLTAECDISQLSFIEFLSLESIPLPEGYFFTLKEVDRGVFEPMKFKK